VYELERKNVTNRETNNTAFNEDRLGPNPNMTLFYSSNVVVLHLFYYFYSPVRHIKVRTRSLLYANKVGYNWLGLGGVA